jgi:hypothetical protein
MLVLANVCLYLCYQRFSEARPSRFWLHFSGPPLPVLINSYKTGQMADRRARVYCWGYRILVRSGVALLVFGMLLMIFT